MHLSYSVPEEEPANTSGASQVMRFLPSTGDPDSCVLCGKQMPNKGLPSVETVYPVVNSGERRAVTL